MTAAALLRRLVPKSIVGRLALGSAVLVAAALVITGISTGIVLSRFIRGQIDQRLDAQIGAVATALSAQANLPDRLSISDTPPFDRPYSGWYWTASTENHVYRSASLDGGDIVLRGSPRWWDPERQAPPDAADRARPLDGSGPRGEPLYLRTQIVPIDGNWVTIVASSPAHALVRPLRDALVPVVLSMLALGLLLGAASALQLRLGLRPLAKVTQNLERVRSGKATHISEEQPRELTGLVGELNSLIVQNAEGIKRARGHVSNLGHALNTPLAALSLSLGSSDTAADAERMKLVSEMQDRIRHHLARARAAALHGPVHMNTAVTPSARDIVGVLEKIHSDRNLTCVVDVPESLAVACEPQDLDEMLGNVLDNAFKWASTMVRISGRDEGNRVRLVICDDGPGISAEQLDGALKAGRKLDETVAGHGFGLSITRELAELYGGSLALARSSSAGLETTIVLPSATAH